MAKTNDSPSKWNSVKDIIGKIAPGLATALGGPLAGVATGIILAKLGMGPGEDDKAIAALQTDPDAILKLKLAELEFQKFLRESDIKLVELDVQDRASARNMAISIGQLPTSVLASIYTIGFFVLIFGLFSGMFSLPSGETTLFSGLVGTLSAAQMLILNFYFGSSSGSARKDQTIRDLTTFGT